MSKEYRFTKGGVELRQDSKTPVISGYAAVFSPAHSEDLGGFVEELDPHCFDETIKGDIRGLYNHDKNQCLGRTKSGTMRLSLDAKGLFYEIDVPDTQVGRDLVTSMKRGDVDSSSFGFVCQEDRWDTNSTPAVRTLLKVDLFDCSVVQYPAYSDATSQVRSMFPDGIVEVPKPVVTPPEKRADECSCTCPECVAGECDNCSNTDCDDPDCRCNSMRSRMGMRLEIARSFDPQYRAHGTTQKVDDEDLTKNCFAYRFGDVPSDWKLPIKFSTDAKSETHVRDALSRWADTQMLDADEKAKARTRILAAAKKFGIDVSDNDLK
jgi:HK97 family phage prohead protease